VAALVLALAGCGGGTGTLTGKVTHKTKTVVYGTVMVVGADGITRSGNIEPDGTYKVEDVPAGAVKLAVVSPEPIDPKHLPKHTGRPGMEGKPAPYPTVDRARWFKVPDKYGDPEKSGLTTTVRAGATPHDITLP
jgi:hypothetical protein